MDKYIVIDNPEYVWFFCRNLKDKYVPISLNVGVAALLDREGIKYVNIFDYLNSGQLKDITKKAFAISDLLLEKLDKQNRDNYRKIFKVDDVCLMKTTIKYLFTRFLITSLRIVTGLEGILKKYRIGELAYLHDGNPEIICGTRAQRGFLFPDDVVWDILKNWQVQSKPGIVNVKGLRRKMCYKATNKSVKIKYKDTIRSLRISLHPFKKRVVRSLLKKQEYSAEKKTLLFIGPLYDFSLNLDSMYQSFNVMRWDSDGDHLPAQIKNIPASSGAGSASLDFNAGLFNDSMPFSNLYYEKLASDLIQKFYEKKLPDILRYWQQAKSIYDNYKIDMVLWNNAPHRYPGGIVKEFFRLKSVPVCGMQHGGLNGSNDIGETFFDMELNNCDYYFSYGFTKDDLNIENDVAACKEIIPVGSLKLQKFSDTYTDNLKRSNKKIDILFPVAMNNEKLFVDSEVNNPRLVTLQKKIIDLLAGCKGKRIVLKFLIGQYERSSLGKYIEHKHPGKFEIIDYVSFTKLLEDYSVDTIFIEEQSTPLNESALTKSNIIVLNNSDWYALTDQAYQLLSKRAIICDDEGSFLEAIKNCLDGQIEKKDNSNREFIEKYCIYKGDTGENIERAIRSLVSKGGIAREKTAYAN